MTASDILTDLVIYFLWKPAKGFRTEEDLMNHTAVVYNNLPMHESAHFTPRYGCLPQGGVKAFPDIQNEMIHCNSGHLWVTFEDDTKDYILGAGESLVVATQGKTLIGGPGCYRISHGSDGLDLAAAS